jgi:endo-1,4-beta-xylanase
MKTSLALLLAPLAALASPTLGVTERQASASIDALFKAKGKLYIGVATDQNRLSTGKSADVIKANFGQVTPENSMKWDTTESTQGKFNFAGADYLVNWATTNNKTIRGHTFCWHSQLPGWVSGLKSKDTLTSALKTHITTVMTRYKGQVRGYVRPLPLFVVIIPLGISE